MINTSLEGDHIFDRVPEIHPLVGAKFRLFTEVKADCGFITQEAEQEPNLLLADTQRFTVMPLVSSRQALS